MYTVPSKNANLRIMSKSENEYCPLSYNDLMIGLQVYRSNFRKTIRVIHGQIQSANLFVKNKWSNISSVNMSILKS